MLAINSESSYRRCFRSSRKDFSMFQSSLFYVWWKSASVYPSHHPANSCSKKMTASFHKPLFIPLVLRRLCIYHHLQFAATHAATVRRLSNAINPFPFSFVVFTLFHIIFVVGFCIVLPIVCINQWHVAVNFNIPLAECISWEKYSNAVTLRKAHNTTQAQCMLTYIGIKRKYKFADKFTLWSLNQVQPTVRQHKAGVQQRHISNCNGLGMGGNLQSAPGCWWRYLSAHSRHRRSWRNGLALRRRRWAVGKRGVGASNTKLLLNAGVFFFCWMIEWKSTFSPAMCWRFSVKLLLVLPLPPILFCFIFIYTLSFTWNWCECVRACNFCQLHTRWTHQGHYNRGGVHLPPRWFLPTLDAYCSLPHYLQAFKCYVCNTIEHI